MNVCPSCWSATGPSFTVPPDISQGYSGLVIRTPGALSVQGSLSGAM